MYEAISKLFTIKNIGQISSLENELRSMKMEKDDIVASSFVNIAIIRNELQEMDEIVPEKELVITALLGLPTSWSAFASRINSWKDTPTFKKMWNACNHEEARISLVNNKKEDEEENISNAYFGHHMKNTTFKKFKEQKKKIDLWKIE